MVQDTSSYAAVAIFLWMATSEITSVFLIWSSLLKYTIMEFTVCGKNEKQKRPGCLADEKFRFGGRGCKNVFSQLKEKAKFLCKNVFLLKTTKNAELVLDPYIPSPKDW